MVVSAEVPETQAGADGLALIEEAPSCATSEAEVFSEQIPLEAEGDAALPDASTTSPRESLGLGAEETPDVVGEAQLVVTYLTGAMVGQAQMAHEGILGVGTDEEPGRTETDRAQHVGFVRVCGGEDDRNPVQFGVGAHHGHEFRSGHVVQAFIAQNQPNGLAAQKGQGFGAGCGGVQLGDGGEFEKFPVDTLVPFTGTHDQRGLKRGGVAARLGHGHTSIFPVGAASARHHLYRSKWVLL